MSQQRRTTHHTNQSQGNLEHYHPQHQLRSRGNHIAQRKELPSGAALYTLAFIIQHQMIESLRQPLTDTNIAACSTLELPYYNASEYQAKAVFSDRKTVKGSKMTKANTPLAAYFGQVHEEDDSTRPGIAYRQGLTMREKGYGGTTRVYNEDERIVYDHHGDGVDEQGFIFNAAGFRQRCKGSNMKLIWTRPSEAERHP